MLNIIELERQWLKYKIKTYIPLVTIGFSITIITGVTVFFLTNTQTSNNVEIDSTLKEIATENLSNSKIAVKEKEIIQEPIVTIEPQHTNSKNILSKEEQQVKLSPSLDFIERMQSSVQPYYKTVPIDSLSKVETEVERVEIKEESQKEILQEKKVSSQINIKRKNTKNDIYEIIRRFKKNHNPALSLFIAKKYYELGDYRQSYNYSLITNEINKGIESSWIVFAKSLVKLGKKDKAISTLEKYIKHSHSSSAKILYDEIKSGKFQ